MYTYCYLGVHREYVFIWFTDLILLSRRSSRKIKSPVALRTYMIKTFRETNFDKVLKDFTNLFCGTLLYCFFIWVLVNMLQYYLLLLLPM